MRFQRCGAPCIAACPPHPWVSPPAAHLLRRCDNVATTIRYLRDSSALALVHGYSTFGTSAARCAADRVRSVYPKDDIVSVVRDGPTARALVAALQSSAFPEG